MAFKIKDLVVNLGSTADAADVPRQPGICAGNTLCANLTLCGTNTQGCQALTIGGCGLRTCHFSCGYCTIGATFTNCGFLTRTTCGGLTCGRTWIDTRTDWDDMAGAGPLGPEEIDVVRTELKSRLAALEQHASQQTAQEPESLEQLELVEEKLNEALAEIQSRKGKLNKG